MTDGISEGHPVAPESEKPQTLIADFDIFVAPSYLAWGNIQVHHFFESSLTSGNYPELPTCCTKMQTSANDEFGAVQMCANFIGTR